MSVSTLRGSNTIAYNPLVGPNGAQLEPGVLGRTINKRVIGPDSETNPIELRIHGNKIHGQTCPTDS